MKANITRCGEKAYTDLGGGVSRRILSYNNDIMMVEVRFEKGGVGAAHAHEHVQSTYVLEGSFRFDVEGESAVVRKGDTLAFPSGVVHGTECLESGVLLDVFTPMREDFLG